MRSVDNPGMADIIPSNRSGGIDIHSGTTSIGGDVAGRDVTKQYTVHLDRPIELHGSRMLPRNPLFVGREATLRQLAARLNGDGALVILTGYGGLGKTQTAIELAQRYADQFPGGVFWLSCAQPDLIGGEIAACGSAGRLSLPGYDELPQPDKVNRVLGEWPKPIARLLIFDNAEGEGEDGSSLPKTKGLFSGEGLGVRVITYGKLQIADYAAVRTVFERALKILKKFLGTDHPSTKTIRENLAWAVAEMESDATDAAHNRSA